MIRPPCLQQVCKEGTVMWKLSQKEIHSSQGLLTSGSQNALLPNEVRSFLELTQRCHLRYRIWHYLKEMTILSNFK